MTTREQNEANSKYWEVAVDYAQPGSTDTKLNTYLRLGTAEANAVTVTEADTSGSDSAHRGHDLASMVQGFIDDDRTRGPHLPTSATRTEETGQLHSKGGWRDHSDGNRISTTRGDKVEVIRGNYRMLVLGRQDDAENCAEWDASGGLIQDGDIAPGAITEIKWEQNPWSGTWTVTEECAKGNVISKYHGNVKEEFYGDTIESIIGSAGGAMPFTGWVDGDAVPPQVKSNPTITETTYAKAITSTTTVDTTVIENTVVAGAVVENTVVGGAATETLTVGGIAAGHTAAAAVVETLATAFYTEASIIGTAKIEVEVQPMHISVEASGLLVDFFAGVTVDIHLGPTLEMGMGGTFELGDSTTGLFVASTDIDAVKQSVEANVTAIAGNTTAIEGNTTAISGAVTDIAGNTTAIAANSTELTALKNIP